MIKIIDQLHVLHDLKHFCVIHYNIKIEKNELMHTIPWKLSYHKLKAKILAVDVRHITAWRWINICIDDA